MKQTIEFGTPGSGFLGQDAVSLTLTLSGCNGMQEVCELPSPHDRLVKFGGKWQQVAFRDSERCNLHVKMLFCRSRGVAGRSGRSWFNLGSTWAKV